MSSCSARIPAPRQVSGCIDAAESMSLFLKWLTDKVSLRPTRNPIDPGDRERLTFPVNDFEVEVWKVPFPGSSSQPGLLVIKFPGTAGRAEWAGPHPLEVWGDAGGEVWALNHRGYGGSHGPASLQNFSLTIDCLWNLIQEQAPDRKILVCGNSLGCLSALYMAKRFPVDGLMLRNGFCLARLIYMRRKYNWWNLGMAAHLAQQVPEELHSIRNAKHCHVPCLFIRSEKDTVIPGVYQIAVFNEYAGPKKEFLNIGADHADRISESQSESYLKLVDWLRGEMGC